MKKIIFLFITFFTFYTWLNNVSANEMKLWSIWSYEHLIPIYWTWWAQYNEQMLFYKFTPNLIIYNSLWNSIFSQSFTSDICWTGNRYFVDLKDFYFIYNCDSSMNGGVWYYRPKVFIVNKYTRQITTLTHANWVYGANVFSLQFYYKDWIFYFKYNNQFYNFIDNKDTFSWAQIITNPWFTFFTSTHNVLYRYMPTTWFFISSNYKEIFFALNTFSQKNIVLSDKFSTVSYSNIVSYDWKTYFSQQNNLWELKTIICDFDNYTNCSVAPDEFISFYNYNSWKWYKLRKTTYDELNLLWAKYYYWFFDKDSQKYMKWYLKTDWFLYVDISSLWGYFGWSNSWWWETPTPSSPNCYIKDSYQFTTLNDISLHTENINDYTIDVWDNYLTYIKNSNQDEFWLIYDNFSSISYKDSNNNELTWTGINVLFNTSSYIDLKTSLIWETSFFLYHDKPFNEITLQCKNVDTAKSRFTLYTSDWDKTDILDWNLYINSQWDFACWDTIKFQEAISMVKIKVKWFRYNLQLQNIIIKQNEITTLNNEICFDSTTWTYTKDWEEYEPTDQEKKEIAKNINTDLSTGSKLLEKIFWSLPLIPDIIWLFNIVLPDTPSLSFVFPIPKLTSSFKITTQNKTIILQEITDVLFVSEIEENTLSQKFISFIFAILYIIYRAILISWILFLFYFYYRIIDKIFTSVFWANLNVWSIAANWFSLLPYTALITYIFFIFVSFLVVLSPVIEFINGMIDLWTVFFSFFALNIADYSFFQSIVNMFFALVWWSIMLTLIYRLTLRFSRLN